jgi:hypothetical protein
MSQYGVENFIGAPSTDLLAEVIGGESVLVIEKILSLQTSRLSS